MYDRPPRPFSRYRDACDERTFQTVFGKRRLGRAAGIVVRGCPVTTDARPAEQGRRIGGRCSGSDGLAGQRRAGRARCALSPEFSGRWKELERFELEAQLTH
jgi:hypothetical protein